MMAGHGNHYRRMGDYARTTPGRYPCISIVLDGHHAARKNKWNAMTFQHMKFKYHYFILIMIFTQLRMFNFSMDKIKYS